MTDGPARRPLVLPGRLVDDIVAAKGPRELWSGVTDQLTLADFISCGGYDRQLRRMRCLALPDAP